MKCSRDPFSILGVFLVCLSAVQYFIVETTFPPTVTQILLR